MNFIEEAKRLSGGGKRLGKRRTYDLYATITWPPLNKLTAQRDTVKRVDQMKMDFVDKDVFCIGFNIGAIPFEIWKRGAFRIGGIEYLAARVDFANAFAKHYNMNADFEHGDIHTYECCRKDVLLCMSIDRHVQDPKLLYLRLARMTKGTLLLESNLTETFFTQKTLKELFSKVELLTATGGGRVLFKCQKSLI